MPPEIPLVFLPGTLCTEATFEFQRRHLSDICRPLVLPLSDGETSAEMAARVLERSPERFALAGFSQGAIVAFEIVRRAPERVDRLALLDANPRPPSEAQLGLWQGWRHRVRAGEFDTLIAGFADGVHPQRRSDPALRALILDMARSTGPDTFVRQLTALASRSDSRPSLGEIDCPTLLLVGRQDLVTPLALHEEMQQRIPGALLVPIEECGHYSPLEQPQAVTAALRLWLQL